MFEVVCDWKSDYAADCGVHAMIGELLLAVDYVGEEEEEICYDEER